jgi:hypothetical protein
MAYDPRRVDQKDIETAEWYAMHYPKKQFEKLQEHLSKRCRKNQKCVFVREKATFICGGLELYAEEASEESSANLSPSVSFYSLALGLLLHSIRGSN